jgi:hypothetical protein
LGSSAPTATRPSRSSRCRASTPIAITRYTIGKQGVEMTGEEAEITEGVDEEMESMRRVEQRAAEFAARRASELTHSTGPRDRP